VWSIRRGHASALRQVADKAGKPRHVTICEDLHEIGELLPRAEAADVQAWTRGLTAGLRRRSLPMKVEDRRAG